MVIMSTLLRFCRMHFPSCGVLLESVNHFTLQANATKNEAAASDAAPASKRTKRATVKQNGGNHQPKVIF